MMPGTPSAESGSEGEGIEEGVVDAAVEHVDRLVALCGAHGDLAVDHLQVGAFDQFDAHLVGQEGVLEIGGVVDAGRQHGDRRRPLAALRRHACKRPGAGAADSSRPACTLTRLEQLREQLHHGLAVLQHVGDARRRARIVLEHEELVLGRADDVDADDVGIDVARRAEADHLGQERLVVGDQLLRDATGAHDFLAVIDVVEEGIERRTTLLDALREAPPFRTGYDTRNDVERDQALCGLFCRHRRRR